MAVPEEMTKPPAWRNWLRPLLIGLALVLVNVLIYLLLPTDLVERMGNFGYLGAFLSALLANASVVIPVPYYPLLIRLGQAFDPAWVTLLAAAGSTIGELTAFYVGRSGRGAFENTRFYHWIQRQLSHPWRAPLVLFGLSAVPNPAFDIAGLLAGAMGIPLWLFCATVFPGRIIRMATVIWFGYVFLLSAYSIHASPLRPYAPTPLRPPSPPRSPARYRLAGHRPGARPGTRYCPPGR